MSESYLPLGRSRLHHGRTPFVAGRAMAVVHLPSGIEIFHRAHDTLDRLSRISCPTLVTAGENDVQIPPYNARAVAERIPHAEFHLFRGPDAGHLVCFDMKDEFNRVTLKWLRSLRGKDLCERAGSA